MSQAFLAKVAPANRAVSHPELDGLVVPVGTLSMEAKLVDALPREEGWQFEPKWDGFRCLAFKADDAVTLQAKSGKTLTRYFPEVAEAVRQAPFRWLVIDGELAIPVGESISFDSLQLRLHPAESRIRKLANETPAIFINKLVVEVRYDHVTGNRFRHGTKLLRWRPDKSPRQCKFEQLQQEARPSTLVADVLR